mgnify:CR=1 FL=1
MQQSKVGRGPTASRSRRVVSKMRVRTAAKRKNTTPKKMHPEKKVRTPLKVLASLYSYTAGGHYYEACGLLQEALPRPCDEQRFLGWL